MNMAARMTTQFTRPVIIPSVSAAPGAAKADIPSGSENLKYAAPGAALQVIDGNRVALSETIV